MPAFLAALLALGLTVPADARWKNPPRRVVCVKVQDEAVGPHLVCVPAPKHSH